MIFIKCILWIIFWLQPGMDRKIINEYIDNDFISTHIIITIPAINIAFYWIVNKMRFLDKYKIQKRNWRDDEKQLLIETYKKFINSRILLLILYFLVRSEEFGKDRSYEIPTRWHSSYQLIVSLLISDTFFYCTHRLAHTKWFYRIHKQHHEYTKCEPVAILWTNFSETILVSIPIFIIPVYWLQMHKLTLFMWLTMTTCHGFYEHCNYDLPVPILQFIPFGDTSFMHSMHHIKQKYNYGIYFDHMDKYLGTATKNLIDI